jgi:hypothetical protein
MESRTVRLSPLGKDSVERDDSAAVGFNRSDLEAEGPLLALPWQWRDHETALFSFSLRR